MNKIPSMPFPNCSQKNGRNGKTAEIGKLKNPPMYKVYGKKYIYNRASANGNEKTTFH